MLMRHLNYNHLLYFWTVSREGSIAKASELLHVTPQTISGQLKLLEDAIGEPLFERVGRGLVITNTGKLVEQYADEIFKLGSELSQRLKSNRPGLPVNFKVGIVSSIPKLIAYQVLKPSLTLSEPVKVHCIESDLSSLLGDLATNKIDVVLSDQTVPSGLSVKLFSHKLGTSSLILMGHPMLLQEFDREDPEILSTAPLLLPIEEHALRRNIDDWFYQKGITPNIVAEFDDSALMKAFGEAGVGFFPVPQVMQTQVEKMYQVEYLCNIDPVQENYFLISPERKITHPAVLALSDGARTHFIDS